MNYFSFLKLGMIVLSATGITTLAATKITKKCHHHQYVNNDKNLIQVDI